MTEGLISRQKDMKNLSVIVIRFDRYAEYPPPPPCHKRNEAF